MASKISKETSAIARGMGDKIGQIILNYGMFVFGFAFSFYWGWLMTCILLAAFPVLAILGVVMAVMMEEGTKEGMRAYSQSSGYAEQALSAIKVVHTYGQELLEMENYNKYLIRAKKISLSQTTKKSFGGALLFLLITGFYGYSFYWGGYLRANETMNGDKIYTGGIIITIMFCVVFGSMGLGGAGPHMAAVAEG